MTDFSYLNVDNAYKLINQKVIKTPLITNDYINNLLEAEIYFKLENLQNTGSFKLRGATPVSYTHLTLPTSSWV